jgi:glycosyltransferase involved in cell wall biosynthesis
MHVIDSLNASGGAENRLVEEAVALTGRHPGIEQSLVHLFARDDLARRLEAAGIPVTALGFDSKAAARSWPLAARRLRAVLRDRRPDLVHTAVASGNLVGQLAAGRLGIPVVSTFNRTGDPSLQPVAGWRGRVMQAVGRAAARRGDVWYRAVSAHAVDPRFDADRVTVIPRGIALDDLPAPADRSAFGPGEGPVIVNVGRLVPEKAQHLLVEAFAGARRELPGARLVIVGAGGRAEPAVRATVQAAIGRHGVGDAVQLLGFRDDARALVAAADVFAFSSLSEGSPGAVLEAMALGTPVAAFDIPPVADLTGGGRYARLAPAGDAAALGRAIVAAHRSPPDGVDAWVRRFDVGAVVDRLAALFAARAPAATEVR